VIGEWLGSEGDHYRRTYHMNPISEAFRTAWTTFLAERCDWTIEKIAEQTDAEAKQFDEDIAAGRLVELKPRRRKRRAA
jgi:hypothetical protein